MTPNLRFLFSHPAHLIACGLGSGLSPIAPGTAGTLFAWLTYPLLRLVYPASAHLSFFFRSMSSRAAAGTRMRLPILIAGI